MGSLFRTFGPKYLSILPGPFPIFLLLLWIGNDSWGKSAYPGFVTGKLSDLAGLIVTPLFIGCLLSFVFNLFDRRSKYFHSQNAGLYFLTLAILLTDVFFIFINWRQDWNNLVYLNFLNSYPGTADRMDLFCIPSSWFFLSYYYFQDKQKNNFIEFRELLVSKPNSYPSIKFAFVSILCVFALINTSRSGGSLVRLVLQEPERNVLAGEKIPILFYTSCSLDGIEFILYEGSDLYRKDRVDKNDLEFIDDKRTGFKLRKFEYVVPKNINPGEYRWEIRLLFSDSEYETAAIAIHTTQREMDKAKESLDSIRKRIKHEHERSKRESNSAVGTDCHEVSDLIGHNIHESENVSHSRIWRILQ